MYIDAIKAENRITALFRTEKGYAADIFNTAVDAAQTVIRDMCDNESIDIDKITEVHEKLGYERGWRDGYAESITEGKQ